jgi:hypothetical protein
MGSMTEEVLTPADEKSEIMAIFNQKRGGEDA